MHYLFHMRKIRALDCENLPCEGSQPQAPRPESLCQAGPPLLRTPACMVNKSIFNFNFAEYLFSVRVSMLFALRKVYSMVMVEVKFSLFHTDFTYHQFFPPSDPLQIRCYSLELRAK